MGNEGALRSSMVCLAVLMALVWLWTQSLRKTLVTYGVGVSLIAGIILPDWDFFDRPYSRWLHPVTAHERAAALARNSYPLRFRVYPMRIIIYCTVYGIALYKWWMFVST